MTSNTQDKLLSEDALKDELYDMAFEVRQDQEDGEYFFLLNEKQLLALIQSQKIAHADMVIGEDVEGSIWNALRAEQRERNKV